MTQDKTGETEGAQMQFSWGHGRFPRAAHVVPTGTWRAPETPCMPSQAIACLRITLRAAPDWCEQQVLLQQKSHRWHIMGIKPSRQPGLSGV